MSDESRDGGPAFPSVQQPLHPGLSKRDWFAGQALNGVVENEFTRGPEVVARICYEYADAMLRARSTPPAGERP